MIIWLASYPRSGNTFMRVVINRVFGLKTYSIHGDLMDIAAEEKTAALVGHAILPEDFDLDSARKSKTLFLIKTHAAPSNSRDKTIYLVRDGRESTLSYMNYLKDYGIHERSLKELIFGLSTFGSWGDHLREWDPLHRENTLLIRFEELVDRPKAMLEKLQDFIDCDASPNGNTYKIPSFQELHGVNPAFFRNGKKDSWKTVFSNEEHEIFWLKNSDQMQLFGYDDGKPKLFESASDVTLFRHLSTQISTQTAYLTKQFMSERIDDLETRTSRQAIKIEEQHALINELHHRLQQDQSVVEEKQRHIEKLKGEIRQTTEAAATMADEHDKRLDKKNKALSEQRWIVDNKQKQLEKLEKTLTEKSALIGKKKNIIDDQHREIGLLKKKCHELQGHADEKLKVLHKLRGELQAKEHAFKEQLKGLQTDMDIQRAQANRVSEELGDIKRSKLYPLLDLLRYPSNKPRVAEVEEN